MHGLHNGVNARFFRFGPFPPPIMSLHPPSPIPSVQLCWGATQSAWRTRVSARWRRRGICQNAPRQCVLLCRYKCIPSGSCNWCNTFAAQSAKNAPLGRHARNGDSCARLCERSRTSLVYTMQKPHFTYPQSVQESLRFLRFTPGFERSHILSFCAFLRFL